MLTGAQPAPRVPDDFARRFPVHDSELEMVDLRVEAPRLHVGGPWATFTGFKNRKKDESCIDFVFGGSDGGWCVLELFVLRAWGLMASLVGTGR